MRTDPYSLQIKTLPREERWTVFRFLSREFEEGVNARLFDEFTLIGSDTNEADVRFAEPAQAEVLRHG
ncbi:MAG: hypothetical protein ACYDH9_24310 [Limisphaerales bacterium]